MCFAKFFLLSLVCLKIFFRVSFPESPAFNFNEAEAVVKLGTRKNAEWSVALGIEISLIYIYIYILRIFLLFSKNNS